MKSREIVLGSEISLAHVDDVDCRGTWPVVNGVGWLSRLKYPSKTQRIALNFLELRLALSETSCAVCSIIIERRD